MAGNMAVAVKNHRDVIDLGKASPFSIGKTNFPGETKTDGHLTNSALIHF